MTEALTEMKRVLSSGYMRINKNKIKFLTAGRNVSYVEVKETRSWRVRVLWKSITLDRRSKRHVTK